MFPYSGYHPTTAQPGYSQVAARPAAGAMTGPMMTGAQPVRAQRSAVPARAGELPEWAQEPQRRPLMLLILGFTLSTVGIIRPGLTAILA